jgi:hypothetical protein
MRSANGCSILLSEFSIRKLEVAAMSTLSLIPLFFALAPLKYYWVINTGVQLTAIEWAYPED